MELYTLPKLGFEYDALEPFIDEATMRVHHDGHHKSYVTKLNQALEPYPSLRKHVEELLAGIDTLPPEIKTAVKNNAGGHANHTLFWTILTPKPQGKPKGTLIAALEKEFNDTATFQKRFSEAAMNHFSNGWAWLCTDSNGKLSVFTTKDHDSPITRGLTPLLVLDLWEHAYYLKYQNRRAEYVESFWNIVNWDEVSNRWNDVQAKGATNREWRMAG